MCEFYFMKTHRNNCFNDATKYEVERDTQTKK